MGAPIKCDTNSGELTLDFYVTKNSSTSHLTDGGGTPVITNSSNNITFSATSTLNPITSTKHSYKFSYSCAETNQNLCKTVVSWTPSKYDCGTIEQEITYNSIPTDKLIHVQIGILGKKENTSAIHYKTTSAAGLVIKVTNGSIQNNTTIITSGMSISGTKIDDVESTRVNVFIEEGTSQSFRSGVGVARLDIYVKSTSTYVSLNFGGSYIVGEQMGSGDRVNVNENITLTIDPNNKSQEYNVNLLLGYTNVELTQGITPWL